MISKPCTIKVGTRDHTVFSVVSDLDGLVKVLELLDSDDGAEDLLLGNLHIGSNIGKESGLDVVTLVAVTIATQSDSGTLLLAVLDVVHDAVELELGDLRTLEGILSERVTELVLRGTLLEASDELVVDAFLDQHARAGATALTVIEEDTEVGPRDGVVDVSIVENNVGRLATQLKGDLLEVALGRSLEDQTANLGRTSEGNLVDVHVVRDGVTSNTTQARDDVDNTLGEASFLDQLTHVQTRERGLLSGLDDNGVTSGKRRGDLPRPHEDGEIPRNDLTADTNGLVAGVGEGLRVGVNSLAVNLVRPSGVVANATHGQPQVNLGHAEGLAVVQGLNGSYLLKVALHKIRELVDEPAPVRRGNIAPLALEGGTSRSHGGIDILLGGFLNGGNRLLVGRVNGLDGLALGSLDVLVVDEPETRQLVPSGEEAGSL